MKFDNKNTVTDLPVVEDVSDVDEETLRELSGNKGNEEDE